MFSFVKMRKKETLYCRDQFSFYGDWEPLNWSFAGQRKTLHLKNILNWKKFKNLEFYLHSTWFHSPIPIHFFQVRFSGRIFSSVNFFPPKFCQVYIGRDFEDGECAENPTHLLCRRQMQETHGKRRSHSSSADNENHDNDNIILDPPPTDHSDNSNNKILDRPHKQQQRRRRHYRYRTWAHPPPSPPPASQGDAVQGGQSLSSRSRQAALRSQTEGIWRSDQAHLQEEGQDDEEDRAPTRVRRLQAQGSSHHQKMQALRTRRREEEEGPDAPILKRDLNAQTLIWNNRSDADPGDEWSNFW